MMPAPMMAATQAPAASLDRSRAASGARLRPLLSASPSLGDDAELAFRPDDEARSRSRPDRDSAADIEDLAVISTMRTPSRLFVVTPYFRQCAPPELVATLPPRVQAIWLEGSGA